jgi:FKBP-type peptidyl-prolyl cis-trans isomerase
MQTYPFFSLVKLVCIFWLVTNTSCQKSAIADEKIAIEQYVQDLQVTPDFVLDDVHVIIKKNGGEEKPNLKSSICILNYTTTYLDGQIVDDRHTNTDVEIKLTIAIKGLQIALPLLGKGSEAIIIVPSRHAYANNPPKGIRRNSILVYDLKLIDF